MSAQQESVKNSEEIYKKISKFVPDVEWKNTSATYRKNK